MQAIQRTNRLSSWITSVGMSVYVSVRRSKLLAAAALAACILASGSVSADDNDRNGGGGGGKWAASWATSIQAAYVLPTTPQAASVPGYDP